MKKPHIVIVIPARFASTRFPGKPLHPIAGKPLIRHVWEKCLKAKYAHRVIVATDEMRIAEVAFEFGAEVSITSPKHPSGTDRIAEVIARIPEATHVLNVQGDEPGIDPRLIDRLAVALTSPEKPDMVTAMYRMEEDPANPNVVKVVTDRTGYALYFSRLPIPCDREGEGDIARYGHLGIYGYTRSTLLQFVKWKPTPLEKAEKLEQLRALEHGTRIKVLLTRSRSIGVDTPEDAKRMEKLLAKRARKPPRLP